MPSSHLASIPFLTPGLLKFNCYTSQKQKHVRDSTVAELIMLAIGDSSSRLRSQMIVPFPSFIQNSWSLQSITPVGAEDTFQATLQFYWITECKTEFYWEVRQCPFSH